jgi:hypothetical protein
MCFHRSRYWEERAAEEPRDRRLWDLLHRETERSAAPMPVAERDEEHDTERDRDEVPVGAEH